MTVTREDLSRVEQHWAVAALGPHTVNRALNAANAIRVRAAVGQQLRLERHVADEGPELIERVALAFELAATQCLDQLVHQLEGQAEGRALSQAGAFRAYELRSVLPIPNGSAERAFHVLHLSALAYCGERWTDLRRWYATHENAFASSHEPNDWSDRILTTLFDCWIRLFRKNGWVDLREVSELIAALRAQQSSLEPEYLSRSTETHEGGRAAHLLLALYHWARASELLSLYMLQGEPRSIDTEIDFHFEAAHENALAIHDAAFEVTLRWLHVASRRMIASSIWWVARTSSSVGRFVQDLVKSRAMFELLPPQRAALQEQGLLDPAARAIVVELPTSGGKTTLAQFRILQALNQFRDDNGWVAYVAPTRALVSQVTRRLRQDFKQLNIEVEQLTSAVDIDPFEEDLLSEGNARSGFQVLVSTPEKLHFVIRNGKVTRPLALLVMDEAHNIEDADRGLRIELLLATVKLDCPSANFLLLMPFVPNAGDLARWLGAESGRTISLGTTAWQPNERVVGMYKIIRGKTPRGWRIGFETLTTTPGTIHLAGDHEIGKPIQRSVAFTSAKTATRLTGEVARIFSDRGTSIGIARTIPDTWSMARSIREDLPVRQGPSEEIELVQRFLREEISADFELVELLSRGIGVHHAGLSDETRALIEWLTEAGKLKVLCATTTIAQGINFPVSSVFLSSRILPARGAPEMSPRTFWNLAGRAGRVDQSSVGVVGLAAGNNADAIRRYVGVSTGALVSRLVTLLDDLEERKGLHQLDAAIRSDDWTDFRSYVAHLWCEKRNLDAVIAESEQLLRNTFGYGVLQAKASDRGKAKALLEATKNYARELARHPGSATLADATGFSPEGVRAALAEMSNLPLPLESKDWRPESLFGDAGKGTLANLVGVMMRIPQIRGQLEDLSLHGIDKRRIALVAQAWVNGRSIESIATEFFSGTKRRPKSHTDAITEACRGIYKTLANAGTWGLAALAKLPKSGIDFEKLSDAQKREVGNLPAMLYHGVSSEGAVLMRMNAVPRSIAERLGERFASRPGAVLSSASARSYLRTLRASDWAAVSASGHMSGADYQRIWHTLSGEQATS